MFGCMKHESGVLQRSTAQLSRDDWLEAAWDAFVSEGIGAVSVLALAKKLSVTRGSFYHHFEDRADLLRELLRYWRREYTLRIRNDVAVLQLEPAAALLALARLIRSRGAASHDVRVRAWSIGDPEVRELVRQVDQDRLGFIRSQFLELGFDETEAECRARMVLYYGLAEPAMLAEQSPEQEEELLRRRLIFLTER